MDDEQRTPIAVPAPTPNRRFKLTQELTRRNSVLTQSMRCSGSL